MLLIRLLEFSKLRSIISVYKFVPLFVSIAVFAFLFPTVSFSQGNLLITPRRVVFEGNVKSIDLNLANIGQDSATYAISLVQIRMNENGSFETITEADPGQLFADKNIRFFPRTVELAPNEAQVVKVQLLRSKKLEPGEYRSHFYFRSVPKPIALGEEEEVQGEDTTAISVRLRPLFGITIPAIIRVGESTASVSIADVNLQTDDKSNLILDLKLKRTGNFSVFGDLKVNHISSEGEVTTVGTAKGIAVYTPNEYRDFQLTLLQDPELNYRSGKLQIIYSSSSDVKPEILAETELLLH